MHPGRAEVPKWLFAQICGQISGGRKEKWQEKKEMTGDGAREWVSEKTDFWAVATPLLAAFSRPTPSAPGVATAQVGQRICSLRRWRNFKQTTQQI